MRRLAIIALSGIALSAVFLGAGAALEGKRLAGDFDGPFGRPRCENGGGYPISRTLDWDGSDHAGIAIPGLATYAPSNDGKLHVSGNPVLVPHIRVRDGRVELDCRIHGGTRDLSVTLPGRAFRTFSIAGGGQLNLNNLDQASVEADIGGSGTIKATGKVGTLKIEIGGSGQSDFGQVATRDATVEIGGSGTAHIAPTNSARIEIGGSGDVYLHSNPRSLDTEIGGAGRIHKVGG